MPSTNNSIAGGENPRSSRVSVIVLSLLLGCIGVLLWVSLTPDSVVAETEWNRPDRHPVFGRIHETTALDVSEIPYQRSLGGQSLPRNPQPLMLGSVGMEWSVGTEPSGYLYCWSPVERSDRPDYWEFALCDRTRLLDLTEDDLAATFVGLNDGETGERTFGADWQQNGRSVGIKVTESTVILARLVEKPSRVFAIEFTDQDAGKLTARYLWVDLPPAADQSEPADGAPTGR